MSKKFLGLLQAMPLLALLAFAPGVLAADPVQRCIAQHVDGQLFRNQARLEAAQREFAQCSSPACPAIVRDECIAMLGEVDSALPSVVLSVLDEPGAATTTAFVRIDGAPELVPLDGRSLTLDPGAHRLSIQNSSGATWEVSVSLREFEHDRAIEVDLRVPPSNDPRAKPRAHEPPVEASMESPEASHVPVMLVSGGVALAALGGFTYFALSGHAVAEDLDRCKPNCPDRSELGRLRTRYLAADVSLGVALVSAGIATYAWLTHPTTPGPFAPQQARLNALRLLPVASHRRVGLFAEGDF